MSQFIWILLLVIIIVLAYLIYRYYTSSTTTLTASIYLNSTDANAATKSLIPAEKVANPKAANFSISYWIYVNSWNSNSKKYVFSCSPPGNYLTMYFDENKPTLYAAITTGCKTHVPSTETIKVTDSFPLQKWVYVILSVNSNFVDMYLDGRLINSYRMQNSDLYLTCSSDKWGIQMGSSFDAYVYNFVRDVKEMTPQTAMSNYYSTAPKANNSSIFGNYNMNIDILKDGTVSSSLNVF